MPILSDPAYEKFAQGLVAGKTAIKAFTDAGFAHNYGNCIRLKQHPDVKARVAEILGRAANRAEITIADVVTELAKIGFVDIRGMFTDDGSIKRVEDIDDDTAAAISSIEVITRRVPGGDADEVEQVAKFKLYDKRAALVDIGKHLGMFVERVEHTGKDGGAIEIAEMSPTEQARRIAFALARGTQGK